MTSSIKPRGGVTGFIGGAFDVPTAQQVTGDPRAVAHSTNDGPHVPEPNRTRARLAQATERFTKG